MANHTLSQLSSIVGKFNSRLFNSLNHKWIPSCSPSDAHHRFALRSSDPAELRLDVQNGQPMGAVVLALIDGQHKQKEFYNLPQNAGDSELPVILVVGINYFQGPDYASHQGCGVFQDTWMRGNVDAWLGRLALHARSPSAVREGALACLTCGYHLVVFNHFPYVTARKWSEGGGAYTELFQDWWGAHRAQRDVTALVNVLHPDLLLFHGKDALRRIAKPPAQAVATALVSNIPGKKANKPEQCVNGRWTCF